MNEIDKAARIAGVLYLALVITGMFHLLYVPSQLIEWSDGSATVANIKESELLFRTGIVATLLSTTIFIFLALALYRLFKPIDVGHASVMVILVLISVPISFVNSTHLFSVLALLGDAEYVSVLDSEQITAQIMLQLDAYFDGVRINTIFWGLWLYPFGVLVLRSGYLPKVLGILLILGCFGYLLNFCGRTLFEGYSESVIPRIAGIPASLGELGSCLWLLIFGVRTNVSGVASKE